MTDDPYCKNIWYYAFHGSELKAGQIRAKTVLGENIVFGRAVDGKPFALRDNCPHRGVPLSDGSFDGQCIQCCYHGWKFDAAGICQAIPALADPNFDVHRIKVYAYPCRELNGTIWVYMPADKQDLSQVEQGLPDLIIAPEQKFLHVETVRLPTNADHSVVGLIDPAHVTFVHQSWFWRTAKAAKLKTKNFEPVGLGFKMTRHAPSGNSKGYSILGGKSSTEITFQLPGHRIEHITIEPNHLIVSITMLTPLTEQETELNHIVFGSLPIGKYLWLPLKQLAKTFIGQDLYVFEKLSRGLASNPKLMLIGDPDTQARWYFELKRQWQQAQLNKTPFVNPLKPQTLQWVT